MIPRLHKATSSVTLLATTLLLLLLAGSAASAQTDAPVKPRKLLMTKIRRLQISRAGAELTITDAGAGSFDLTVTSQHDNWPLIAAGRVTTSDDQIELIYHECSTSILNLVVRDREGACSLGVALDDYEDGAHVDPESMSALRQEASLPDESAALSTIALSTPHPDSPLGKFIDSLRVRSAALSSLPILFALTDTETSPEVTLLHYISSLLLPQPSRSVSPQSATLRARPVPLASLAPLAGDGQMGSLPIPPLRSISAVARELKFQASPPTGPISSLKSFLSLPFCDRQPRQPVAT
jgi:hypothetical protein